MYLAVKRLLDIVLSVVGLFILAPFLLLIAVLIKLFSKGPVIFRQKRLGKDGRVFEIYKFRTMVVNAEQIGSGVYSSKGDPRVSGIGQILRSLSIDELPQLFNVIKGDMSLIGPRPPLTYHPWLFEEYNEEQRKRFLVRPGVTGWAQIHGRKNLLWEERIVLDVEYVENLSFIMDIKIFLLTIFKVITMQDNLNVGETSEKQSALPEFKVKM